jgi:hypothetical protein
MMDDEEIANSDGEENYQQGDPRNTSNYVSTIRDPSFGQIPMGD